MNKAREKIENDIYDYICIVRGIEFANDFDYSQFNELLDEIEVSNEK